MPKCSHWTIFPKQVNCSHRSGFPYKARLLYPPQLPSVLSNFAVPLCLSSRLVLLLTSFMPAYYTGPSHGCWNDDDAERCCPRTQKKKCYYDWLWVALIGFFISAWFWQWIASLDPCALTEDYVGYETCSFFGFFCKGYCGVGLTTTAIGNSTKSISHELQLVGGCLPLTTLGSPTRNAFSILVDFPVGVRKVWTWGPVIRCHLAADVADAPPPLPQYPYWNGPTGYNGCLAFYNPDNPVASPLTPDQLFQSNGSSCAYVGKYIAA